MLARLMPPRLLQLPTRFQSCCHQVLQQHQQTPSCQPKHRQLHATCSHHARRQLSQRHIRLHSISSNHLPSSSLYMLVGVRRLQQDTSAATDVAPASAITAETPMQDRATVGESDSGERIFEDENMGTYIAPSSTESLVFNGIPYNELPIIHIKATYNNTHISIAHHNGKTVTRTSCGTEGFKNAKKGTAIAAQTAAIAAAAKALDKGMSTVRVVIKGIGPGRQTSIKGLQMGGLDIVSITDNTPVPHNGCRPRKARRL